MTREGKRKSRDWGATLLGVSTAAVVAMATNFDFTTFNVKSFNQWIKLLAIVLPAIGGAISTLKEKKPQ
jgi:hypothetical protein